jgi:photosystem II stability/assembly factor-like uncharacterized protein
MNLRYLAYLLPALIGLAGCGKSEWQSTVPPDSNRPYYRQIENRSVGFINAFARDGMAWAVGENSTILRTNGNNIDWLLRPPLKQPNLLGVVFPDTQNGWAVGGDGLILHSADGGKTWTRQDSRVTNTLRSVYFLSDSLTGWIVGSNGLILKTFDGGRSWTRKDEGTVHGTLWGVILLG